MAQTKNLCAQISLDLHQKISEARETGAPDHRAVHHQPAYRIFYNERDAGAFLLSSALITYRGSTGGSITFEKKLEKTKEVS